MHESGASDLCIAGRTLRYAANTKSQLKHVFQRLFSVSGVSEGATGVQNPSHNFQQRQGELQDPFGGLPCNPPAHTNPLLFAVN